MKIQIYKVDAFAEKVFTGNPAAVCILDKWLSDELMQNIAAENNLADTAFIVHEAGTYKIRWFTPTVEVDLCGHATLASAFILLEYFERKEEFIEFCSPRSGKLSVFKENEKLFLDFPTDILIKSDNFGDIEKCIGLKPTEVYKGKTDLIAVLETESEIRGLKPDFAKISGLDARGLVISSRGKDTDFVSRFFAPQSGIQEDPVTGSAHTSLTPLWSKKLKKEELTAVQLSERGGVLTCRNKGNRCHIGGKAQLFLKGEIYI